MAMPETVRAPQRPDDVTERVPVVTSDSRFRRFRPNRTIVIVLVAIVLAAGAGVGIWLGTSGSASPPVSITTQVVDVTTGTMQQTVSTSGTVEPAQQDNLNFAVSGKVTAVDVTSGQTVTAGQVLATVDPSALQQLVDAAQASLSAAQARLSSDQADGAAASQIDSDDASVTSAQSALTTAETNLSDASLTSPIAGTVASLDLTVGQQVSGGGSGSNGSGASDAAATSDSSASSSSAQVVVIATDSYSVTTTVDDTQVGEVKSGDQAVITPTGSTTNAYGTVSSVGLIASQSSDVAAFPVTIAVTGTPTGLYAGATATVSIIVEQIENAVEVPTAAISYSSGGNATVTLVQNGSDVSRVVTTGVVASGDTQITSGLTSGDKVLERVVKFNGVAGGGGRSLFGGSGAGGFTGGGFGGGGFSGRGVGGGGGFTATGGAGG